MITDTDRLNWLEENLLHINKQGPYMDGRNIGGQLVNKAKGSEAGSSYFRVHHRTIREAIDEAMQPPPQNGKTT